MSLFEVIKSLRFEQISKVFVWSLQHPLFMFATIKATFLTLKIAQKEFPDIHGKHNKANAFRHALWNLLIAKGCAKFSSDFNEILNWTKKFTDWHEKLSPNKEMAKLMDFHNNSFGRIKFLDWEKQSNNTFVDLLKGELSDAILISHKSEFKNFENNLVYLEA